MSSLILCFLMTYFSHLTYNISTESCRNYKTSTKLIIISLELFLINLIVYIIWNELRSVLDVAAW